MSFLNNLFKSQKEQLPEGWISLNNETQLYEAIKTSFQKPVVLFKHSTTCGISSGAKYELESNWDFKADDLDFYYLDLLQYRSISNKIAELTGVIHQSPQVIILKDGKVLFKTSHHAISVAGMKKAIS